MSTTTPDFPTLLAQARIAALRALTDILATSKDPKEIRHAATAILRIKDPKPSPPPRRAPPAPDAPPSPYPNIPAPVDPLPPTPQPLPRIRLPRMAPTDIAATIDLTRDVEDDFADLLNIDLPLLPPPFRRTRRRRTRATHFSTAAPNAPPGPTLLPT